MQKIFFRLPPHFFESKISVRGIFAKTTMFLFLFSMFALLAIGFEGMNDTLAQLETRPIELSCNALCHYALCTTLRMLIAMLLSLLFTFVIGSLAAKSKIGALIIIPAVDILQAVPVLGFLTCLVPFFMNLFPGKQYGVEAAAIFAIFSSQVWNMIFGFYQSLMTIPQDLKEVSIQFKLSAWQKFLKLELPFAMSSLIWNMVMSMSSSWFFLVASEAISLGNTKIKLPGIGSWLAVAIENKNVSAVLLSVIAISLVIFCCNQFLFNPLLVWSQKFNMNGSVHQRMAKSWFYDWIKASRLFSFLGKGNLFLTDLLLSLRTEKQHFNSNARLKLNDHFSKKIVCTILALFALIAVKFLFGYLSSGNNFEELKTVFTYGFMTMLRVLIAIFLLSFVWVPIGVLVGQSSRLSSLLQPIAQFLASFPANILYPVVVIGIVKFDLNPEIFLPFLMILGTQWYIFFNVVAGTMAYPHELREVTHIYQVRSWLWWRKIMLPAIFPYYVTGALTAAGGSWNASIVSEVVSWGSTRIKIKGLGSYIAMAAEAGNLHQVALGIVVMSIFVIALNRLLWQRLYVYAEKNYRLVFT